MFAQDLAQDLPQEHCAVVLNFGVFLRADATITEERCRTVMGTLGLIGEKATRARSARSRAARRRASPSPPSASRRAAILGTREPTNHLDVEVIDALLVRDQGSTGRRRSAPRTTASCEAIEATHVGYVANGQIDVEERTLRESDFPEADPRHVHDVAEEERELAAVLLHALLYVRVTCFLGMPWVNAVWLAGLTERRAVFYI